VERYYNEPIPPLGVKFVVFGLMCGLAVVLVAAANVVNLLLVRGTNRAQEIAVRMALGASRTQIVYELFVETSVLAFVGAVSGFLIAFVQWRTIDTSFAGRDFLGDVGWRTIPIAMVAGVGLALIIGVWPGLRASAVRIEGALRDVRRSGIGGSPLDSLLGRLVAASTAATVMLLICASLLRLSARDLFADNGGLSQRSFFSFLTLDASQSRTRRVEVVREALARVRSLGGVRFAVVGARPGNVPTLPIQVQLDAQPPRQIPSAQLYEVSDGYFHAFKIRFLEGRGFSPAEMRDSTNGVVISRQLAATIFGRPGGVGQRFRYATGTRATFRDAIVIGVAENLPGGPAFQLFTPVGQAAPIQLPLLVGLAEVGVSPLEVRRTLRSIPSLLSSDLVSFKADQGSSQKVVSLILSGFTLFAIVGMVLAVIGTYAILAHSVERRTHEIGVRIALGARRLDVTKMILEQGLKVTVSGVIFGLVLSYVAAHVLGALLTDLRTSFSASMLGVVLLVLLVSTIACLIPGYRAGGLSPVEALRAD
jgi:predicted permease